MIRKILFTAPGVTEIVTEPIAPPAERQVQIRLVRSTVSSGTERANLLAESNLSIYGAKSAFPRICGYSCSAVVTAVGAQVKDISVGDRVAVSWSEYRSKMNISEKKVHKLPDNVSFDDGGIFHIATFPMAAIRKCRLELGESAIVMGMGVLGLLAIPLLKAAGAAPILAVDPVPEKRKKALECGADYVLDPFAPDFAQEAKRLTGGGANVGIEVTGVGAGLDGVLDCMARFGRVALLGCTRDKEFTIDYYKKVHGPGITLIGAHTMARPREESYAGWWTDSADMEALIRLTELGRLHLSELVDEVHPVEDAVRVFDRLAAGKAFPIVQLDWTGKRC